MAPSSDLKSLVSYISELQVILSYYYLLTFDQELRLVWYSCPWGLGKILFLLTRYVSFLATSLVFYMDAIRYIDVSSCAKGSKVTVFVIMFQLFISRAILTLRIWIIWRRRCIVTWILAGSCIILAVVGVSKASGHDQEQSSFGQDLYNAFGICPPFDSGAEVQTMDQQSVGFLLLILYDSVLFGLTLVQAWGIWCENTLLLSTIRFLKKFVAQGLGSSSLVNSFFTDGLSTTFLILAVSIANIIIRCKASVAYVNLLTASVLLFLFTFSLDLHDANKNSILSVSHSIFISRMMLKLRESRSLTDNVGQSSISSPQFAAFDALSRASQASLWFGEN
ncbi:hypothetical protein WG66_010795 [Moniliophthora roreri]|nr:hypothetical protein WG66_010795 [Moniliophthora roreri]